MGLNVRRDPLCLIQISTGNSDAHIIQFDRENYNAPNLAKILNDSKITKIFHYGRADLAHIKYYLKIDTNNILDTKIASKLARSYSDSHSLKTLIKEFINIDISKQFQSSDFGGELSPAQLKYCANDVIYLHKIFEIEKVFESLNIKFHSFIDNPSHYDRAFFVSSGLGWQGKSTMMLTPGSGPWQLLATIYVGLNFVEDKNSDFS